MEKSNGCCVHDNGNARMLRNIGLQLPQITLRKIEKAFQPGDPALDLIPKVIEHPHIETREGDDNSHFATRY
jgi:hypothetical protein